MQKNFYHLIFFTTLCFFSKCFSDLFFFYYLVTNSKLIKSKNVYQKLNFKENYLFHFDNYPACNQSSNIEAVPNHFYCFVMTILSQNITKESFTIFFLLKHVISFVSICLRHFFLNRSMTSQSWKKRSSWTPQSSTFKKIFRQICPFSAKLASLYVQIRNYFKNVIFTAHKWCKICKEYVTSIVISCSTSHKGEKMHFD